MISTAINVVVFEKDLKSLGNTTCEVGDSLSKVGYEGGTYFSLSSETSGLEIIMLRSILNSMGYSCSKTEDAIWTNNKGEEVFDVAVWTTYPYERYLNL